MPNGTSIARAKTAKAWRSSACSELNLRKRRLAGPVPRFGGARGVLDLRPSAASWTGPWCALDVAHARSRRSGCGERMHGNPCDCTSSAQSGPWGRRPWQFLVHAPKWCDGAVAPTETVLGLLGETSTKLASHTGPVSRAAWSPLPPCIPLDLRHPGPLER